MILHGLMVIVSFTANSLDLLLNKYEDVSIADF